MGNMGCVVYPLMLFLALAADRSGILFLLLIAYPIVLIVFFKWKEDHERSR